MGYQNIEIMNKKSFVLIFFFIFSEIDFLFSKELDFKLIPYTGFECGVFDEAYYYDDFSEYSDKMCSLLEWKQNYSFILGLEVDIDFKNFNFFTDVSTKLPLKCGKMYDSDYWENGLKFNYSINELYLNNFFCFNTGFSYSFDISSFSIAPVLQGSYSYISLSAKNGYGWYGGSGHSSDGQVHSWNSPFAHYYPDGKYHLAGVDYENQTFYFMLGLDFSKVFFKKWCLGFGLYVAPFTYIYVKDHHLGKSNNFYSEDYIYNYFENYKFLIRNNIFFTRHISLVTLLEGNLQLLVKGENYENGKLNSQKGGESLQAIKLKAGIGFSF